MRHPEKERHHAGRLILLGGIYYLSSTESIRYALNHFDPRNHPENFAAFNKRVDEFDHACAALGEVVSNPRMSRNDYLNCLLLRSTELKERPIPTLSQIVNSEDKNPLRVALHTFQEINRLVHRGKWEFPTQLNEPAELTSGLLIEGYGLFLERMYDVPGLSRKFVVAFEEVLWNKFQGSGLLNDVVPWMIEERGLFSYKVQQGLAKRKKSLDSGLELRFEGGMPPSLEFSTGGGDIRGGNEVSKPIGDFLKGLDLRGI